MTENIPTSTMNVTVADTIVANEAARKLVPGFGGRICAALVWDGTDEVRIPEAVGKPSEGQMVGTPRERLVELAGRICYDSLGTGRKSPDYHANIIKINHGALWEHAAFTVRVVTQDPSKWMWRMFNRPGVFIEQDDMGDFRITLNLRAALEWNREFKFDAMGDAIHAQAHILAPNIARLREVQTVGELGLSSIKSASVVEPETDEEKWITLYLTGSRGWSHELVRHGDWTAISQRSTRYVDESESEWVMHPLVAQWLDETGMTGVIQLGHNASSSVGVQLSAIKSSCAATYDGLVSVLQEWLIARGIDKFSARKQARGAARGLLGNALETEVIFSASVAQWRHMLNMRAADAADAEIRLGFAEAVLPCLRASRYADRFQDFALAPAKDGIGRSLSGGGAK